MKNRKVLTKYTFIIITWLLWYKAAARFAKPPFKIVHLGDSYSAGNGARNADGDKNFYSVSKCYRSQSSWGHRFAQSLADVFSVTYILRACSGSMIADITNERKLDDFSNVIGNCPNPDYPDEEIFRREGMFTCTRYLRPQIEAVDTTVDLVIFTIGRNDAQLDNLVRVCFAKFFRSPEACEEAVNFANDRVDEFGDRLNDVFTTLRSRMKPKARIALVAYPHLLLNITYQLDNGSNVYDAGTAIRALAERGDVVQQDAVDAFNAAVGLDYVLYFGSTNGIFSTHEPDPSAGSRNPNRWINEFFEGDMSEWYHPNALGHENWGSAISVLKTFGSVGGSFEAGGNVDLVFVVDTTGSMGDEINEIGSNLADLVSQLASATTSYRVAVVSYRDFSERTLDDVDYPARVDQGFTSDLGAIQAGIDSLQADGGGDYEETVLSGIKAAIDLPWRPGVTKVAVVIGDAPALTRFGVEPISGLTPGQVVADSIAVDPVQVIGVNVGGLITPALLKIVDSTGGTIFNGIGTLTSTLSNIIQLASAQPFAWFGSAVAGKIGVPVVFDAQGSYDPQGNPIDSYEWDFDGDGTFDVNTREAEIKHIYDAAFEGRVVLRVTSVGGSSLASARTVINAEGSVSQGNEAPCELDENGYSIIITADGIFNNSCTATNLPTEDQPGVYEITDNFGSALDALDAAVKGIFPPAFQNMAHVIHDKVQNNQGDACGSLMGLKNLATSKQGKKNSAKSKQGKKNSAKSKRGKSTTAEEATQVIAAVDSLASLLGC